MTNVQTSVSYSHIQTGRKERLWIPEEALFTPLALEQEYGIELLRRCEALHIPIKKLSSNRLPSIKSESLRASYKKAKSTLAVVTQPPSSLSLQPIPPSADWQIHLAQGCPGHCQYCYLAGSLRGPPLIRVFADLPSTLTNVQHYIHPSKNTSFEVSCYTDPLALEHLTGGLSKAIFYFGTLKGSTLRWVTKYDAVTPLLSLDHKGRTHCRVSVNCDAIAKRFEGGTSSVEARLRALRKLADVGYSIGLVIAPIMPVDNWKEQYHLLFQQAKTLLQNVNLTFELITHRFTPGSKEVLYSWYPGSSLEMNEEQRAEKRNKYGRVKYIYPSDQMKELQLFFLQELKAHFPLGKILYWT